MQQYIHGNIQAQGYRYVASDLEFFLDGQRSKALSGLVTYDLKCHHGDLMADEHRCYWMVTTDLNKPGDQARLFLQAAGGDGYRDSFFAHGYMSDKDDGDLYGPEFPNLLKTRFCTFSEAMDLAAANQLTTVSWLDLPRLASLEPAQIEREILGSILLALLDGRRVYIRLKEESKAAMEASRAWLLAIYSRLPYEKRRSTGFMTGYSGKRVPQAIRLVLLDGDTSLGTLETTDTQDVFDLTDPGADNTQAYREEEDKLLVDFLMDQSQEGLNAFFQFCRSYTRKTGSGATLDNYRTYLDLYNIDQLAVTDKQIRTWATSIESDSWEALKEEFYDKIAKHLPPQNLADYLRRSVAAYPDLENLGVKAKAEFSATRDIETMDANAGLSLRMTEQLLERYGADAQETIGNGLARRFLELAYGAYPGLDEEKPTAATLAQLKELPLYDQRPDDLALVATVKQGVREFLAAQRSQVEAAYAEQTKIQNDWALAQIAAWNFASLSDFQAVEGIYAKLQNACYLYDELVSGWHGPVAGKILDLCGIQPQTLEDHGSLVRLTQDSCNAFAQRGGKLTEAQQKTIGDAQTHWNRVLELDAMPCVSVERLLDRFDEITRTPMAPALALQMKAKHAADLAADKPKDSMILANAEGLCTRAMDPAERELLKDVVAAAQGLNVVTEKKTLTQTVNRLSALAAMNKVGLYCEDVDFQPWGETAPAEALLNRIAALKNYRKTSKPIRISDRRVQQWILRMFPENAALLLLLAKQEPGLRSQLVQKLARLPGAVTEADLRELYVSGCSRSLLKAGAGKDTAPSWQEALEALFPKWPSLPQPLQIEIRTDDRNPAWVIVAAAVLLALAAALPGGAMVLLGGVSLPGGIVLTAVLTLAVIAMLATALLLKQKAQKTLAWAFCGALVPGLVLAVVSLLLTIL